MKNFKDIFEFYESKFGLYQKWKELINKQIVSASPILKAEILINHLTKINQSLCNDIGKNLKDLIKNEESIKHVVLDDYSESYLKEIEKYINNAFDAVKKNKYKELLKLYKEYLPSEIILLIEVDALKKEKIDKNELIIYSLMMLQMQKEHLSDIINKEGIFDTYETKEKVEVLLDSLNGKKLTSTKTIIILLNEIGILNQFSTNSKRLSFCAILSHFISAKANTIDRYIRGINQGGENDPYNSYTDLENAATILDASTYNTEAANLRAKIKKNSIKKYS